MEWFKVYGRLSIGRRGIVLMIFGTFDLIYGWSLLRPPPGSAAAVAQLFRNQLIPAEVWAWAWVVAGVILIVQAFMKRDMVGYSVGIAIKISWAAQAFAGWAYGGISRGWVSGLVWLVFAGLVAVIAGWPEPVRWPTVPLPPERPEGSR